MPGASNDFSDSSGRKIVIWSVDDNFINWVATMTQGGDTTGGSGGGIDSRISKLEVRVGRVENDIGEIKTDIREIRKTDVRDLRSEISGVSTTLWTTFLITWGGLIAVALGLAWMMAKGFGWLDGSA